MLENPIYPEYRQALPRFVDAKKHWTVDTGSTLMDTESFTDFYNSNILAQSRDYNSTYAYGVSSHKDVVNKAFRPPLTTQEDLLPLSRLPRLPVIPRINPTTVVDGGGTITYEAQNERSPGDISKMLTEKIKHGLWRPTYFAPVDVPITNEVLPDLTLKLPSHSANAGFETFVRIDQPLPDLELDFKRLGPDGSTGYDNGGLYVDSHNPLEDMELQRKNEQVYVNTGYNPDLQIDGYTRHVEESDLELNRPFVSVSAGMNTPMTAEGTSMYNTDHVQLFTKVEDAGRSLTVMNPAPTGDQTMGPQERDVRDYVSTRIQVQQSAVPDYNFQDLETNRRKIHFRTKIAPSGSINSERGIAASSIIPQKVSADLHTFKLKPQGFANERRKKVYRL